MPGSGHGPDSFPFHNLKGLYQNSRSPRSLTTKRGSLDIGRVLLPLLRLAVSIETVLRLFRSFNLTACISHDVAPQSSIIKTFDRVYQLVDGLNPSSPVNAQEIALIFMIMCQGTLYNIEMAHNDASAEEWLRLAQQALVKGEFMAINTIPGVQTLVCSPDLAGCVGSA